MLKIIEKLRQYHKECMYAFMLEFSIKDLNKDNEAKKLVKRILKQGERIEKVCKILDQIGVDNYAKRKSTRCI